MLNGKCMQVVRAGSMIALALMFGTFYLFSFCTCIRDGICHEVCFFDGKGTS